MSNRRLRLYNRHSELVGATAGTNVYGCAYDTIGNHTCVSANSINNINLIKAISNDDAVVTYTYADDRSETGYVLSLTNGMTFTRSVTRDAHRPELVTGVTNVIGSTVRGLVYTYDNLARPISRNADSFGYNTRSEVTEAVIDGYAESHTYDYIGNSVLSAFQSATNTYVANALNQYLSISGETTCSPTYNANGDLLTFGAWSFTYDADSRLLTVSSNGVLLVANAYDCQGRRVRKTTPEAVTTFLYDDWNLIRENVAYTSGEIDTFEYFWGRDLSGALQGADGVGGLLYVKRNGMVYIPFADANGNVTAYADSTGSLVAEYAYDAFGRIISATGTFADSFRFRYSTKYTDPETGLICYGYRYYAPTFRRWLTRDSLEEVGGLNLYAFCDNNAVNRYDADGNSSYDIFDLLSDAWCDDVYRYVLENHLNTEQEKAAWTRYTNHGWRGSNRDITLSADDVKKIAESIDGVKETIDYARVQAQAGINVNVHTSKGGSAPAPWIRALGGVSVEITASGKNKCFSYTYRINDLYDFDLKWIRGDFSRDWKAEVQTAGVAVTKACLGCNWTVFCHVGEYRGK